MTKIKFCCPNCAYSKSISENEIPQIATQCKCPSCKKILLLSEAIIKSKSTTDSSSIEQSIEECFAKLQVKVSEKTEKKPETSNRYFELFDEGLSLLDKENVLEAMLLLEEAESLSSTPKVRSYLAYCRAKANKEYGSAIKMCMTALKEEPTIADHYFNLGRIYLLSNKKGQALHAFQKGIKFGPHPPLMHELRKFDKRKPPVISSLPREHVLNRYLGKFMSRLGLR